MARVVVIGAGPAGSVFSARMAQMGHDVTLIERVAFPRSRLGESLSPGVVPLLAMTGAQADVERAGFRPVRGVTAKWNGDFDERTMSTGGGLLVDRGRFDALLLSHARALGVRVLQPAVMAERQATADGWTLGINAGGSRIDLHAQFVADASGRAGAWPGRRRLDRIRTIALYAYWRGTQPNDEPRIEAGDDAWFWRVPLPDGRHNVLAFVDAGRLRQRHGESIAGLYQRLVSGSTIMAGLCAVRLDGAIRSVDATPYLEQESISRSTIKIGDAALAIDPISSSGVQKGIQTALAGAVAANTLLRRPALGEAAIQFYSGGLTESAAQHRSWAAGHYAVAAKSRGGVFWTRRAAEAVPEPRLPQDTRAPWTGSGRAARLSPLVEFVDLPCLDGDFVTRKVAVRHSSLASPVAYLGRWELAPLLRDISRGMTTLDIAKAWSDRIPLESAATILGWLMNRGILIEDERT
ncbi:MAG: NAD(P)/FAD-dependent oxidoreductase [Vicinamibacterales bacterium]